MPWTVPSKRTTLFYKYMPRDEAYSGQDNFFAPSDADGWDGIDRRRRAILSPPPREFVERKALATAEAERG